MKRAWFGGEGREVVRGDRGTNFKSHNNTNIDFPSQDGQVL